MLNVGYGHLSGPRFPEQQEAFLGFLLERGLVPPDVPRRWHGHAYRLNEPTPRRVVGEGVVLVGDAAGLAYPVSGEGILPAVESGRLAARAILEARPAGAPLDLGRYVWLLREFFGTPKAAAGGWWLPEPVVARVGVKLLASRWFARHVLLGRWFLHGRPGVSRPS